MRTTLSILAVLLLAASAWAGSVVEPGAAISYTQYVVLTDSTTGAPKTGIAYTAVDLTYTRNRAAAVKADAVEQTNGVDGAFIENAFIEVDATNAPGLYRVDWENDAFATGVTKVILSVKATGCLTVHEQIDLEPVIANITEVNGSAVTGSAPDVNVVSISGDTTAADNAELMFDGTGYAGGTTPLAVTLVATGLDAISVTPATNVATNFREMMVQVWRRFFKKSTLTADTLSTFADDGTTPLTEQAVSDVGGTQTQGAAAAP